MESGKLPVNVLKKSVLKHVRPYREEISSGAAVGNDCAAFSLSSGCRVAICHREGVIVPERIPDFPGSCSIKTLLTKTVNNLLAGGARPTGLEITLFLPEGTEHEALDGIMKEADAFCAEARLQILGGQTRVTETVSEILCVVTALGEIPEEAAISGGRMTDCDVVVTKSMGLEGTAILAEKFEDRIREHFPEGLIRTAKGYAGDLSLRPEAEVIFAMREEAFARGEVFPLEMHDASEGGILAALKELAERAGVGLDLDLKKLPIRQETIEIAELCDVNPYELLSGGSMLVLTPFGAKMTERLQETGIPACIVGKTTAEKAGILHNEEEIRFLDRPGKDALYRE